MQLYRRLTIVGSNVDGLQIDFGVPTELHEYEEMCRLRHDRYVDRGYIAPQTKCLDMDEHDLNGTCRYAVAYCGGRIIGSARLICESPLPTEAYCFRFEEPEALQFIPANRRAEVSRLVADKFRKVPESLVVIGLIATLHDLAVEQGVLGGYLYLKEGLWKILEFIGIPLHPIETHELAYLREYMHGYFYSGDRAIPMHYITNEVGEAIQLIVANGRGKVEKHWETISRAL